MRKLKYHILLLSLLCLLGACRSNKEVAPTVSVTAMETVSLGNNGDGTITLRAWGSGQNRADAIEQAMLNAVRDVIFKGIKKGTNPGAASRPLVSEVNAEERYARYFEPFFSGPEYRKFVKEEGGTAQRMKSTGLSREGYGVVVIVDRAALRKQLIEDGVLSE